MTEANGISQGGTLWVCATPLGNLEDVTLRVLTALREADLIAAEDTRHTQRLLSRYDIHTPVVSYHEHNEASRAEELVARLKAGANVALVSDAGTPGVSDPGHVLIERAIAEGVRVEGRPGPSAAITALVVSGLPTDRFVFEGFLPRKGRERESRLAELTRETRTAILYEAPHRLRRTLADLVAALGPERHCAVARELTKRFEEVIRGSLAEAQDHFQQNEPRGEICLVIGGAPTASSGLDGGDTTEALAAAVAKALEMHSGGDTLKDAARAVSQEYGVSRNEVYRAALTAKAGDER